MIVKRLGRSVTMRMRFSCRLSKKRQVVALSRVCVSLFSIRCWEATGTEIAKTAPASKTATKGLKRLSERVSTQAVANEKNVSMAMTSRAAEGYWARPHTYVKTIIACKSIHALTKMANFRSESFQSL